MVRFPVLRPASAISSALPYLGQKVAAGRSESFDKHADRKPGEAYPVDQRKGWNSGSRWDGTPSWLNPGAASCANAMRLSHVGPPAASAAS
jgi:hypothetical protein